MIKQFKWLLLLLQLSSMAVLTAQTKSTFNGVKRSNNQAANYKVAQHIGTTTNSTIQNQNLTGIQAFPLDFDSIAYTRDSTLGFYEIGYIPDQTVQAGNLLHFYIKADSLGNGLKTYSIAYSDTPKGKITFKPGQQYFNFMPDVKDTLTFFVFFKAKKGTDSVVQKVPFRVYRVNTIDNYAFGVGNAQQIPNTDDKAYQLVSTIKTTAPYFNGIANRPVRIVSISGLELSLDNTAGNLLMSYSGNQDILQMNIYAEKLYIRDTFNLPQTEINIYCTEIVFEDVSGRPKAVINSTPIKPVAAIPGQQGVAGAEAGNINLFAGRMIDNSGGLRLRLIGGDGQNTTNAVSGASGDGGDLFSNLDIQYIADYIGGLAGTTAGTGSLPAKYKGTFGGFKKDSIQLRWIHPNYIRQVLAYCDDAYLLGYGGNVLPKLLAYDMLIDGFSKSQDFQSLDLYTQSDLLQAHMEVISLGNRILSGLDYYGNPVGWVPMLSFEFTQAAFENELQHATKIIYLNSFINASSDTLQKLLSGYTALRNALQAQAQDLRNELDYLTQIKYVEIEGKIAENEARMEALKNQIQAVAEELERRAQSKLDDSRKVKWTDIVSTIGKVATMVPDPTVQAIGAGLVSGVEFYKGVQDIDNFNAQSALQIIEAGSKAFKTFKGYQDGFEATRKEWDEIGNQWNDFFPVFQGGLGINALKSQTEKGAKLYGSLSKKFEEVQSIYDSYLKVPDGDLRKIRSDLMANDPRLAELNQSLSAAAEKHKLLLDEFNATNEQIERTAAEVVGNALMFDNANDKIATNTLVLDHRTVHYINYLTQNSVRRLKKYHYIMAKAFEFRRLQPYTGNLNIGSVFNATENMVVTANSATLSNSQYEALASVYRDQISQIAEDVYDEYTSNAIPQRKNNRSFRLSDDIIERLNNGEDVKVNLSQIGVFNENEENIRLAGLRVSFLKDSVSANFVAGASPEINVTFTYPNLSKIRYRGKVYYFNNYNSRTVDPLKWSTSYNKLGGSLNQVVPSPAAQSLLQFLLTKNNVNFTNNGIYMFSQPSADAEITLSAKFTNQGSGASGRQYIDSVVFQVDYDYNLELPNDAYLDVTTEPEWIVPTYLMSKQDKNGMQNGQDDMTRVFAKSNANQVVLKADSTIGGYKFDKWLDKFGNPDLSADSINPNRTFKMGASQAYKVKYVWGGAILSLPDTLFFGPNTLTNSIPVKNIGSGQMEWIVDTLSSTSWVTVPIDSGTNDFNLPVSVSVNQSEVLKVGYIVFIAPDAQNAIDTVWLVYRKDFTSISNLEEQFKVHVYPNPTNTLLNILTSNSTEKEVSILSVEGKLIVTETMNANKLLDVSNLSSGIYTISLKEKSGAIVMKRFVKQ